MFFYGILDSPAKWAGGGPGTQLMNWSGTTKCKPTADPCPLHYVIAGHDWGFAMDSKEDFFIGE